jgi:prevent-host-death family protein
MAAIVNMHDAKSNLSKLVEKARMGEEVIIAKDGKPVVRLVPIGLAGKQRPMGYYAGKIVIHEDFNDPLPDDFMEFFR